MKVFYSLIILLPLMALSADLELSQITEQIFPQQQVQSIQPEFSQMTLQQPQVFSMQQLPIEVQEALPVQKTFTYDFNQVASRPLDLQQMMTVSQETPQFTTFSSVKQQNDEPIMQLNQEMNFQNSHDLIASISKDASLSDEQSMLSNFISSESIKVSEQDNDQRTFIDLEKQTVDKVGSASQKSMAEIESIGVIQKDIQKTQVNPEYVKRTIITSEPEYIQQTKIHSNEIQEPTYSMETTALPLSSENQFMAFTSQISDDAVPIIQVSTTCPRNSVANHQKVCIKPKYIQGCSVYSTALQCYSCANGYKLDSVTKKCQYNPLYNGKLTHITGCLEQSSDDSCDVCATGFYRYEQKCSLGIKNCVSYNKEGNCLDCEEDYSLIMSECRHNYLLGCKEETASHTCKQCYAPFQLNGQHCDVQNCRTLNDFGCVSCECGFYLTSNRLCKSIAPGCLRYQRGVCKDCLKHYKLKGGVCEIEGCQEYNGNYCSQCQQDYDSVEGECHFKKCYDWLNDSCLVCKEGYGIYNGHCKLIEPLLCE